MLRTIQPSNAKKLGLSQHFAWRCCIYIWFHQLLPRDSYSVCCWMLFVIQSSESQFLSVLILMYSPCVQDRADQWPIMNRHFFSQRFLVQPVLFYQHPADFITRLLDFFQLSLSWFSLLLLACIVSLHDIYVWLTSTTTKSLKSSELHDHADNHGCFVWFDCYLFFSCQWLLITKVSKIEPLRLGCDWCHIHRCQIVNPSEELGKLRTCLVDVSTQFCSICSIFLTIMP